MIFVDALVDGNYGETAAQLAGIAESGVRAWIKKADGRAARKVIHAICIDILQIRARVLAICRRHYCLQESGAQANAALSVRLR